MSSVLCDQCSLVVHSKCAHNAPLTCNPSTANPADFALDVASVDLCEEENERFSQEKAQNLRMVSVVAVMAVAVGVGWRKVVEDRSR